MSPAVAALELQGIIKRFGPLRALDEVSVTVRPGTVHALLGENGAGKTTLMHIAYGMLQADAGVMRVRGQPWTGRDPIDAIEAGIGMVHQHFTLVPAMSVMENLALGGRGLLDARRMAAGVRQISERTGFALDPNALVADLPVGAQQRVEIAKALARDATLLILDEPTAVLAPREVDDLLHWLRGYVHRGNAAVLITHKLREAFAVADDVTVLRHGRVMLSSPTSAMSVDEVSRAMIGASSQLSADVATGVVGADVFDVQDVTLHSAEGGSAVSGVSFTVRGGELVGVAGVEGAGQRELLRTLAGRLEPVSGTIRRPEVVGFVPEDRHGDAVMLDRSLTENVALRGAGTRNGVMPWTAIRERTSGLLHEFDVRASGTDAPMRSLSGGNQQKLVLAREMEVLQSGAGPRAIVVENPTRGLDVRATSDVHYRLRDACRQGAAVVMYSSDIDELLSLASRMIVLYAGSVREVPVEREAVGRAMIGLTDG